MKYIKDDKRVQNRLEKLLRKMANAPHVAIGVLQDVPVTDRFSMVDLAMVHEYGSRDGKIPERSFIRSTCDVRLDEHLALMVKLQQKYIDGILSMKQALTQLGEIVSKQMVQTIVKGIEPELKPATVKRKKSSKPLIDKGRLKGEIKYEVRGAS